MGAFSIDSEQNMLIGYWFLITPEQMDYDIFITKVDQYLNDGVSFLPELLKLNGSWSHT